MWENITINWIAILVSTVAAMAIGATWYSKLLFAKPWMEAIGKTEEALKDGGNVGYAVAAAGAFLTSYVLAHILQITGSDTIQEGLMTALWIWLGFQATTLATNGIFEGKSWKLIAIDAGQFLAVLLVASVILVSIR